VSADHSVQAGPLGKKLTLHADYIKAVSMPGEVPATRLRCGGRRQRQKQNCEAAARSYKTGDSTMNFDVKGLNVSADHSVQAGPLGKKLTLHADYIKAVSMPGEVPATRLR